MRKSNSIKNLFTSVIPFFILGILGFVRIDVFITELGMEIYAINQLFFQLFSYLSLIEGGVGVLIQQQYYQFIVNESRLKIKSLFHSSKKVLSKISILILVFGILLSFFLKYLTNNSLSLSFMQIVFLLFLFRGIMEYLMYSPRLFIQADQKSYKINFSLNMYRVIEAIVEIVCLYLGGNYILILILSIVVRYISFLIANRKIYKEYPWLKEEGEILPYKINGIKDIFAHKIASAVSHNTTIILTSTFLSPLIVGVYASYKYIIKFIDDLIILVGNAIKDSVGNVMYKEDNKNQKKIFEEINSMYMFFAMAISIIIYVVTNQFVELWLGKDMLIDQLSFILMIFIMFHSIMRRPFTIIRDARGLFKETRLIAIIEAVINLVLSIILIQIFGLSGALFAIIISTLLGNFWFFPYYIYGRVIRGSAIVYYAKYFISIFLVILLSFLSQYFLHVISATNFLNWFLYTLIYSIMITIIVFFTNYLLFKHFRSFVRKVVMLIFDFSKRKNKI